MARDFLVLSPAYIEAADLVIRRRRGAVAEELTEKYKARKGQDDETFARIQSKLAQEGAAITLEDYRWDKNLYRGLYRWLRATDDDDREDAIGNIRKLALPIIKCLQEDGIRTWADILRLSGESPAAESDMDETDADTEAAEPQSLRFKISASRAGELLAEQMRGLFEALEPVLDENEKLKAEIERIGAENDELTRDSSEIRALYEFSEEQITALEAQLREAKRSIVAGHRMSAEALAREHPEIPELLTAVQRLKKAAADREEAKNLASQLPQSFSWKSEQGRILYKEPFLRELARLTLEEQRQVVHQMSVLAEQGSEHHSLYTRKYRHGNIPQSPMPCWGSRGADDLRFSWVKNGELVIHWLWRRGDTRVRQSES